MLMGFAPDLRTAKPIDFHFLPVLRQKPLISASSGLSIKMALANRKTPALSRNKLKPKHPEDPGEPECI
jgi:hypothetical protein